MTLLSSRIRQMLRQRRNSHGMHRAERRLPRMLTPHQRGWYMLQALRPRLKLDNLPLHATLFVSPDQARTNCKVALPTLSTASLSSAERGGSPESNARRHHGTELDRP